MKRRVDRVSTQDWIAAAFGVVLVAAGMAAAQDPAPKWAAIDTVKRRVTIPKDDAADVEVAIVPNGTRNLQYKVTPRTASARDIVLGKGDYVFVRGVTTPPTSAVKLVQGRNYLQGFAAWSHPATGKVTQYRVFMDVASVPMPYDAPNGAYGTDVTIGVESNDGSAELPGGAVAVSLTGEGLQVSPLEVRIAKSGVDDCPKVHVVRSSRQQCILTAHSSFGVGRKELPVVERLARVAVNATPQSFVGFGLGSTDVTVEIGADAHTPWTVDRDVPVTIVVDRGVFPPVSIPKGESRASFELRSSSAGAMTLVARVEGVESEPLTLTYTKPWALLLLVAACGAVGGACGRAWQKSARKKKAAATGVPVKQFRDIAFHVASGAIVGVFVLVATLLGLGIANVALPAPATEAGGALIAFLAGYVGPVLIENLAKKAFG